MEPLPLATADPSPVYRTGSGPPLVLLHGMTATWRVWIPVLEALAADHEVIALTLPGHLGAPPGADGEPKSVVELAAAVEARLDQLELGPVAVAGNSLGGWVALELARSGRATRTVALSPAGAWRTNADARRLVRLLRLGRAMMRGAGPRTRELLRRPRARALFLKSLSEHGDRLPPAEIPGLFEGSTGCTVMDDLIESVLRDGPIGPLEHAGGPIRIAWSGRDRTIPFDRYGAPMRERVPIAEVTTLPGVGHVPMGDDPDLVARTILEITAA